MKGLVAGILTATFTLGLGASLAKAQKWTASVPLGDVARQLRIQREKSPKKPRLFTNDDLIALRTQTDQSPPNQAGPLNTSSSEATPGQKPGEQTNAVQTSPKSAHATRVEWPEQTRGEEDYIDRMSEVQVVPEEQRNDATTSPSVVKLAKHPAALPNSADSGQGTATPPARELAKVKFQINPDMVSSDGKPGKPAAPSAGRAPAGQASQDTASATTQAWAKARFHGIPRIISGEPGPIAAPSTDIAPSHREDLGYVETANGQVEAIVARGDHVGLIQETEEFVKRFHFPAPSPAEIEQALAAPPTNNTPDTSDQVADQAEPNPPVQQANANGSPAAGEADVANLSQPAPLTTDNGGAQSEASGTLQSESLADYTGDQFRPKAPETVQPSSCPVSPAAARDLGTSRSTVTPIGYVEKDGGEKQAIVEFHDQVFLVHEGELFADKYRVLRVTASSVEIAEEPTEASSAAIIRRRRNTGELPPDSR